MLTQASMNRTERKAFESDWYMLRSRNDRIALSDMRRWSMAWKSMKFHVMWCDAFHCVCVLICCSMRNKAHTSKCVEAHARTHTHTPMQCNAVENLLVLLEFYDSLSRVGYECVCLCVGWLCSSKNTNHSIIISFDSFHSSLLMLVILYVAAGVFHL